MKPQWNIQKYVVCKSCKKRLPATTDFFHRGQRYVGGLRPVCKECRNAEAVDYHQENREVRNRKQAHRYAKRVNAERERKAAKDNRNTGSSQEPLAS